MVYEFVFRYNASKTVVGFVKALNFKSVGAKKFYCVTIGKIRF